MPIRSISGYIISLLVLLAIPQIACSQDGEDSLANRKAVVMQNQLCIGIDFFQPVINSFTGSKKAYELSIDYALKKEMYLAFEAGFGNASVNYTLPDLRYSSSNSFFRIGFNKSMLQRMHNADWDIVFLGLRYGLAFINRGDALYTIENQYFGNSGGVIPGESLTAHWLEITGGMRVELYKAFCAGYNIRTKFLMNPKALKELAPYSIAGFGKGEKTAIFDFNMYISYALRWNKKSARPQATAATADPQ
jgi:hypothetical protein